MKLLFSLPGGAEWFIIFGVLGLILISVIFYLVTLQSTFGAIILGKNRFLQKHPSKCPVIFIN